IRPYPKGIHPFHHRRRPGPAVSRIPRIYPSQQIHPSPRHPSPINCTPPRRFLPPWSSPSSLSSLISLATYFFHLPLSPTHLSRSASAIGASRLLGSLLGMPRCTSSVNYQTETATMSELICNGCFSLVLYNRTAANVRCSRCNMLNSTRSASQYAHLKCGGCRTTLMYPPGASTVGCATCHHVNPVRAQGSSAPPDAHARPQTVLVENPRTMNDKGKLVSNVAVGVTSWKR
uniref:Zinc finger LSD1-type domain-containing protein n=3 Tax=Triticinae TaxID=1648030 RepID=A0A453S064_AEGTS